MRVGPIPDRKGGADRSVAKCGATENSVRAAPGKSARKLGSKPSLSLLTSYATTRKDYVTHWQNWQRTLQQLDDKPREKDLYRASVAVLRTHESKDFIGGIIASLSIPWGFNKGDEDLGGYHLI